MVWVRLMLEIIPRSLRQVAVSFPLSGAHFMSVTQMSHVSISKRLLPTLSPRGVVLVGT